MPKKYEIKDGILHVGEFKFIQSNNNVYNENGVMEIRPSQSWRFFLIFTTEWANILGIDLNEFCNILKKYGAEDCYVSVFYSHEMRFKTKEQCINFATSNEILPYVMMNKLNN